MEKPRALPVLSRKQALESVRVATADLPSLPPDLLGKSFSLLGVLDLLALSRTCAALHVAVAAESTWRSVIARQHSEVLDVLFEGVLPEPRGGFPVDPQAAAEEARASRDEARGVLQVVGATLLRGVKRIRRCLGLEAPSDRARAAIWQLGAGGQAVRPTNCSN